MFVCVCVWCLWLAFAEHNTHVSARSTSSFFLCLTSILINGERAAGLLILFYCDIVMPSRPRAFVARQYNVVQEETYFYFFRLRVYGHRFSEDCRRVFGSSALPVSSVAPRRAPVLVHNIIL